MNRQQVVERILHIKEDIQKRDDLIAKLIEKNNSERQKLSRFELRLQQLDSDAAFQRAKVRPQSPKTKKKDFLSLDSCENMGLFNKIVLFPVAKCKLHNCYLTYQDVRKRKCVMRMCKHMEWVDERTIE